MSVLAACVGPKGVGNVERDFIRIEGEMKRVEVMLLRCGEGKALALMCGSVSWGPMSRPGLHPEIGCKIIVRRPPLSIIQHIRMFG